MPASSTPHARVPTFDSHSLDGRIAVVTGAAGGLGAAIAHRLTEMGATLVLVDLHAPSRAELPAAETIACDITDPAAVNAMAARVGHQFGRCDVLVNNAGIKTAPVPLENLPLEDWDRIFNVNVRGALLCTQALVPYMLAQSSGSIVNIASIGAQWPTRVGAYAASKAALCGLTRQMANEWGPRGVRANSVSPGMVRTPMSDNHYRDTEQVAARLAMLPLRRFGEPGDIADVVAFLASDAARFVTGQDLVADGGLLVAPLFNMQTPVQ